MRIGIAGFMHESNTFASTTLNRQHFEDAFFHFGDDLIPVWEDAHHELGGFIDGCRTHDLEIVPLMAAWATPGGALEDESYESIVADLLESIQNAGPLDGILLALHGAMVTPTYPSADGETVRRVRALIGDDIPFILSLDMHGNISTPMIEEPDITVAYKTYPHIDQRARGIDCTRIMGQIVRGEVKPCQAHIKMPLLIHIVQQFTGDGAMRTIMEQVEALESDPNIVSASVLPGYIYADVTDMGVSVIVVSDDDLAYAQAQAETLRSFIWNKRHDLNAALPSIDEAVAMTQTIDGTVCLMDSGDNIGGGGPGDSTLIFEALLDANTPKICAVLYDPEGAQHCASLAIGERVQLNVGAKTDDEHGKPIAIEGKLVLIHDGHFVEPEPRHGGTRDYNQGLTVVIETVDGHTVVLNSLRVMPTSLEQLVSLNIDPSDHHAIIVKGVTAPRAAYDPIAQQVICVDSPGVTRAGPESFVYHHRPKPLFPLDAVLD
jgi:microcystin degradation protein MlrC